MHVKSPCPNCGGRNFTSSVNDIEEKYVLLQSATKDQNKTSFTPVTNKALGVILYMCNECKYIMLFNN